MHIKFLEIFGCLFSGMVCTMCQWVHSLGVLQNLRKYLLRRLCSQSRPWAKLFSLPRRCCCSISQETNSKISNFTSIQSNSRGCPHNTLSLTIAGYIGLQRFFSVPSVDLFPILFLTSDFFTCEVKFHASLSSCSKQIYEGLHQLGNVPFDSAFSISLLKYDSDSPLNPCKYAMQSSSIKSPSSLYGARKRISSTSEYLNLQE